MLRSSIRAAVVSITRARGFAGVALLAVAAACSSEDSPKPSLGTQRQALTNSERILSFERVSSTPNQSDWTTTAGALTPSTSHSDLEGSLGIANTGWMELRSVVVPQFTASTNQASLDVLLPGNGTQAWGGVQVFLDAPSRNLNSYSLPYLSVQNLPQGTFQRLAFTLDSTVVSALSTPPSDLVVRITASIPSSSQPTLFDRLRLGQASSGGSGGTGGAGGSSGSAGAGGSSGGGSSGAGGTAGTGSSCPSPTTAVEFRLTLPKNVRRNEVAALGTSTFGVDLHDRVTVKTTGGGFASVGSVGRGMLGVFAEAGKLTADNVTLRNNARVHGQVVSPNPFTPQAGVIIDGAVSQESITPPRVESWTVCFPPKGNDIALEPGQLYPQGGDLPAGRYGYLSIKAGASLRLNGNATYIFENLSLEPGGTIGINGSGDLKVYVKGVATIRGYFSRALDRAGSFLLAANGDVLLEAPLRATVMSNTGTVYIASPSPTVGDPYQGAWWGHGVEVHQDAPLLHEPLRDSVLCPSGSACSALCPCDPGKSCAGDDECKEGVCLDGTCADSPTGPCGDCDCSSECAGKTCGDDPTDSCGGSCASLCNNGDPGCHTDLDCPAGSVCGQGIGARFGFAATANVCWPAACSNAAFNYQGFTGVAAPSGCGTLPACVPDCSGNRLENGCGGNCFQPGVLQASGPGGAIFAPIPMIPRRGSSFPNPLPQHETSAVGTLAGSFQVTDAGTATYTISIEVPPGRLGLQPDIALKYLGTKASGILGVGWGVSGLSTIARCRTSHAQSPNLRPVMLDFEDRFCLDGETLVQVHASSGIQYGGDGAEYVLEKDTTKLRITSHADGLTRTGYFTALTRDGRTLTFGKTDPIVASNGARRVWALEEVEDSAGNMMTIRYLPGRPIGVAESGDGDAQAFTGELLPRLISYGGSRVTTGSQAAQDATRFVILSYEPRTRPAFQYVAGDAGYSNWRLSTVQTWVQDTKVKTYRIQYPEQAQTGEIHLTDMFAPEHVVAVKECADDPTLAGSDQEICKPATTFEYVDTTSAYTQAYPLASIPRGAQSDPQVGLIVLDANGDGRDDLISTGQTNWLTPVLTDWTTNDPTLANFSVVPEGPNLPPYPPKGGRDCFTQASVIDLNRDGRDDLVTVCPLATNKLRVLYSEGAASTLQWRQEELNISVGDSGATMLADYDGDGLRDLVVCHDGPTTAKLITIHRNTGTTFEPQPLENIDGLFNCRLTVFDVDGDGDDDILNLSDSTQNPKPLSVWRSPGRWWQPMGGKVPYLNFLVADFNGDGLRDIISPAVEYAPATWANNSAAITVWFNTGKGFREQVVAVADRGGAPTTYFPRLASETVVLDVDGDGTDDIVTRASDLVSGGRSVIRFVDRAHAQIDPLPGLPPPEVKETKATADLNGDGTPELILLKPNGSVSFATGIGPAHLVHRVRDGLGREDLVEYGADQLIPHSSVYQRTYVPDSCMGGSLVCLHRVAPLVSSYTSGQRDPVTAAVNFHETTNFTYFGAVVESGGHGWFGFKRRKVVTEDLSTTTIDYHTEDFRRAGLPSKVSVLRSNDGSDYSSFGSRTEVTEYEWSLYNAQSSNPDIARFSFLEARTDRLLSDGEEISHSQTGYAVDSFNNVESSITIVSTPLAVVSVDTVDSPRLNDVHGHKIGLVDNVSAYSNRGSHERTRSVDFAYDERGLLTQVTRQPDDPTSSAYQQTLLTPNDFGVVDEQCVVTSEGVSEQRCVSVALDEWSIYPEAVTEVGEGLTTEYIYGAEAGQLLVKTEPSGVVTEFGYDAFGRQNYVSGPRREGRIAYQHAVPHSTAFSAIRAWGAIRVAEQFAGEAFTATTYDAFGRVVQAEMMGLDDTTVVSESLYDGLGRLELASLPHAVASLTQGMRSYEYDTNGLLQAIAEPDGSVTRIEHVDPVSAFPAFAEWFDDNDAVEATVVKLPRGNQKIYVRDHDGNLVRSIDDPNGLGGAALSTRFSYGEFDVVREVVTPKDRTEFYPDVIGRPETIVATSTGARSRIFSGFDQIVSENDGNAETVSYEYDRIGRITAQLDASGGTIAKWEYDGADGSGFGEPFREFRRNGPTSTTGIWTELAYEPGTRGRPTTKKYRVGADIGSPDAGGELFQIGVTYMFNAPGQIDKISYPSNAGTFAVQHAYDLGGNVKTVSKFGSGGYNFWHLSGADEGLRPSDELFGNDVETLRTYHRVGDTDCALDPNESCAPGLLSNILTTGPTSAILQNMFLSNDRNGNITSIHEGAGPATRLFEYDGHDRLTAENLTSQGVVSPVKQYVYDGIGDMRFQSGLPAYTYNAQTRRLDSIGDTQYHYDGNGNQIERSGPLVAGGYQELDLNELELPWHVHQGEGSAAKDVFLEYGADEQRIVKREVLSSGAARTTVSIGGLYERVTTPGGVEHHYKVFSPYGQVAQLVRHVAGEEGQVTYIHADHLGSSRVLSGPSGSLVESRDFEPFGNQSVNVNWSASGIRSGFTGHAHDDDLGLVNMKGRLYDSAVGRFISADPVVSNPTSALGWDRYAYVENNPLAFVDPTGFELKQVRDVHGYISAGDVVGGDGKIGSLPFEYGAAAGATGSRTGSSIPTPGGPAGPTSSAGPGPGEVGHSTSEGGASGPSTNVGGPTGGGPAMGQPSLTDPGQRPTTPTVSTGSGGCDEACRNIPLGVQAPSLAHTELNNALPQIPNTTSTWDGVGKGLTEAVWTVGPLGPEQVMAALLAKGMRAIKAVRALRAARAARAARASLEAFSSTGKQVVKNGLTRAGRAYQKHMGRGELPNVVGRDLNSAGQKLLDDILTNPQTKQLAVSSGNFAGGTRFVGPGGAGATFDANGVFQYFGVYP